MWSVEKLKDMAVAEALVFGRSRALDEVVTEFSRVQNETHMPYDIGAARKALDERLPEVAAELMKLPTGRDDVIDELQAYWQQKEKAPIHGQEAPRQEGKDERVRNALHLGRQPPNRDKDRDND